MVSLKLYVEGGGDQEQLLRRCREGFHKFLEKAGFKGRMPRIVACGGRQAAYDRFKTACETGQASFLLVDSEEPVSGDSPWEHLENRTGDGFVRPKNASDNHCHLMVVCMEAWFLADKAALADFFGQGFNVNALPQNPNVEAVPKEDVYKSMERATFKCKTKAPYGKGEHSFKLLCLISPDKVRKASSWADRFLYELDGIMK